jgi:hypothetical protein
MTLEVMTILKLMRLKMKKMMMTIFLVAKMKEESVQSKNEATEGRC